MNIDNCYDASSVHAKLVAFGHCHMHTMCACVCVCMAYIQHLVLSLPLSLSPCGHCSSPCNVYEIVLLGVCMCYVVGSFVGWLNRNLCFAVLCSVARMNCLLL